ncbi:MAG TPA: HAMP domain-containing sensor histidine kinase [Acidimicrobiales bacterium]|nr:HAMP domain-containing sensor histidine kinase [Acidimicrobiales bacterium]
MNGYGLTSGKRSRRFHAARVAVAATAVVMVCYVLGVVALNVVVVNRLTSQADVRLAQRLAQAKSPSPPVTSTSAPTDADHDIDDAPRFLWIVTGNGRPIALTPGAPDLPNRTWSIGASTVEIKGTGFRFQAIRSGDGWLVAGESLAQLERVQSALIAPELLFGILLLVATFIGSLIIGLRASAPLELIHRRQVEFTADASHELRTPISVIEAEVELALSRNRASEEYREVLERIGGEGHRLRNIVDDLLWLARFDDERTAVVGSDEADLAAVAAASVQRFQTVASAKGVNLRVAIEEDRPARVTADPAWIDRLLGVLVDNACKFAGRNGSVDVSVHVAGNRVVLRVDDSGPGIPVDQRQLVLDRFHRGTETPGGTGLGLAIANSVVRATDGSWMIGDAPGGGARMEVSWRQATTGRSRSSTTVALGYSAGDDRRFAEAHHLPVAGTHGSSHRASGES